MIRASAVQDRHAAFEPTDTITLDETQRHRRRMAMVSDGGIAFLLDLPETVRLRDGDGLVLEDGRILRVAAKPEPLYVVRGQNAAHLLGLAWHLGNRHQAAQIFEDHLFIRRERVLADMLAGLGASVEEIDAPFDPEGGAYAGQGAGHHAAGNHHHDVLHEHGHHGHADHGHGHGHHDHSRR